MVAEESKMKSPVRRGKPKEMFWRKTLARFEASGLTQAEFCRQEKLHTSSLCWWRREIAARDAQPVQSEQRQPESSVDRVKYWRKMIAKFNTSGLSKEDFCTTERIRPMQFTWWRAELHRRNEQKRKEVAKPLDMFVALNVPREEQVSQAEAEPCAIAEINIAAGTVRISDTARVDALIALLRAFKELQ